jgi:mannitol/fructose-specific phosphotransferase system IIA component (Ntr-type)
MVNVSPGLMDLINLKTIKLKAEADNWKEAVHIAGRSLLDLQAIEPRFIEAMIHTILDYGPYMVLWPGVALLHARPEDGVRRLCLSLTTFRKPVNFGHPQHDPVDIAIVLGAVDNRAHIPALLELNSLMQNPATVKRLRETVYELHALNIISSFLKSIRGKDEKQPESVT